MRREPAGRLHPLIAVAPDGGTRSKPESELCDQNPWKQNPWFESVAVAQRRAKKRLPAPVYGALVAGSERGQTIADNEAAFSEIGFAPHVAGQQAERSMATTVMGQDISLPVIISPTGVQAVHPDGEVAVARAAAARGTVMGLSNFASKSVEEVTAANPSTFFQMYWTGDRDVMIQRMERAHAAGAKGLIATLDWSFSMGRDWGSPEIPEKVDLRTMIRMAPQVARKPRWLCEFARAGAIPDLTAPNLAPPGGDGAHVLRRLLRVDDHAAALVGGRGLDARAVGQSRACRSCSRACAGSTTPCGPSTPASPRSRCPTTAATTSTAPPPRSGCCKPIADAVGDQVEVVMDGGIRRGSDVVKAVALGARAVMIGRAYLWGLAANGQAGVENVLDVLRGGIDSALLGMGLSSIHELNPDLFVIPDGFHRALGVPPTQGKAPAVRNGRALVSRAFAGS